MAAAAAVEVVREEAQEQMLKQKHKTTIISTVAFPEAKEEALEDAAQLQQLLWRKAEQRRNCKLPRPHVLGTVQANS